MYKAYQEVIPKGVLVLGQSWGGRRALKRIRKAHSPGPHDKIEDAVDAMGKLWSEMYQALGEILKGESSDREATAKGAQCWEVMVEGVRESIGAQLVRLVQLEGRDAAVSALREHIRNLDSRHRRCQENHFTRLIAWMETCLEELERGAG